MNQGFQGMPGIQFSVGEVGRRIVVGADVPVATALPPVEVPATGRHLRLVIRSRNSSASHDAYILCVVNSDTSGSYSSAEVYNAGASSNSSSGVVGGGYRLGRHSSTADRADLPGALEVLLPYYSDPTIWKIMLSRGIYASTATGYTAIHFYGGYNNTAPIRTLTLSSGAGSFVAGSTFDFYIEH
jgi:hypothetical protein